MGGELLKLRGKKKALETFVVKKVRDGSGAMWAEWGKNWRER